MTAKAERGSSSMIGEPVPEGRSFPASMVRLPGARHAKRIALFGLFGSGNLGNDGSLKAMVEFLREARPDAELFCICRNLEIVSGAFGLDTVGLRRHPAKGLLRSIDRMFLKLPGKAFDFLQAFRTMQRADVMIVPGTGILDDFGEKPFGMPFDIFKWCLAAKLAGARIAFVSIGAGPIRNRVSRWLMVAGAGMADYRSYRDHASMEFMQGLGACSSRDGLYPDLAFRLRTPPARSPRGDGAFTVGVGLMNYRGWYGYESGGDDVFARYVGKMARFVVGLLERGHNVRLLIGDGEDRVAIDALRNAVSDSWAHAWLERVTVEVPGSLDEVMTQIAGVDVLVATRFHNIVCALKMAKPTISIGYASKNDLLMTEMGLGDYCQHIDSFDVDVLFGQFSRIAADRLNTADGIRTRVAEYQIRLRKQEDELLSSFV